MKKTLIMTIVALAFATASTFGQGYFKFASGKSQVWDGFSTPGTATRSTSVSVALFWAANGASSPFSWLTSTPTSGNSTTTESYTASQAWSALTSSSWTLAQTTDAGMNGNVQGVSTSSGAVTFGTGANFGVTGTSPGVAYELMLVSFATSSYGSGAIGWSAPISVTSGTSLLDNTVASPTYTQFGTFVPAATPEPSTMALAGLGGAAMLLFRRRK
jgi:PEP-CTERM motif